VRSFPVVLDSPADRAASDILSERAINLERAVYKQFDFSTSNDYKASKFISRYGGKVRSADFSPEIRSLFLNLKDKGNPGLRDNIVVGHLSVEDVMNMSKEVSSPCAARRHC
jgi:transcription elongation factor S-II